MEAWSSAQTTRVFTALLDLGLAALLALFLLASGDTFRRKLVQLVGPTLSARRVTVEILDEIDTQVQRYLLVLLVTNVLIAIGTVADSAGRGDGARRDVGLYRRGPAHHSLRRHRVDDAR